MATRVVRGAQCATKDETSGCRAALTRTVWDGDQVLYEIRVPGDSSYQYLDSPGYEGGGEHGGVVGYLHGAGGVDRPLALWKRGSGTIVVPLANGRGAYVAGRCGLTDCAGTVWFPGAEASVHGTPPTYVAGPPSWHGSILESGQDASGFQYRRNRYYDPASGRFTQEDPIGLAGGLNLYGYANGDPVNLSDPFGLWPKRTHDNIIAAALAGSPDVRALQVASARFDRGLSQLTRNSYQHGMRAKGQSAEKATAARDAFVASQMHAAINAGGHADAMKHLGIAMHTVMDSHSPAHVDEGGSPKVWRLSETLSHRDAESRPPTSEEMAVMGAKLQAMYNEVMAARSKP